MEKQQAKGGMGKKLLAGAFIVGVGAALYALLGPKGKENRKKLHGWAVKMTGEIIEKLEEAKEISEPVFNKIVDAVSEKYSRMQSVGKADLDRISKNMKKHWRKYASNGKKSRGSDL